MSRQLATLIHAEREHAFLWWDILNQLRLSSELPEWVYTKAVGSNVDYEESMLERGIVNHALFGTDKIQPGDDLQPSIYERQRLIDLMESERTRHLTWWTTLNEMRARRQLPEWVVTKPIGHGPDHERWSEKAAQVNQMLFGQSRVRHLATQLRSSEGSRHDSRQRTASLTHVNC
jgi:hypothetical protein